MIASRLTRSKRLAKRVLLEAATHVARLRDTSGGPTVLVFPTGSTADPASNLRAYLAAPELRRLGWRVVIVPPPMNLAQRQRLVRLEKPDVIFMQQTRHLLNRPKLYAPVPVVLDADDADYVDPGIHDMIVESATDAAAVVGGSRFVAECLGRHNPDASVIWTCTPTPTTAPRLPSGDRPPIVAWAHGAPLTYVKEAALMQEVMIRVAERMPFTFWLFGTRIDDGDEWLKPLRRAGASCTCIPMLDYESYLAKVAEAAVGVQPVCIDNEFSRGKSFGKVLAYLAGDVAVVASAVVDHPLFFEHNQDGMLVGDSPSDWVASIHALLADPALRGQMVARARAQFLQRLTMPAFARLLDPILRRAAGLKPAA